MINNNLRIPGRLPGKIETNKSKIIKPQILLQSKSFFGTKKDTELQKELNIARNTYYKYKKELKQLTEEQQKTLFNISPSKIINKKTFVVYKYVLNNKVVYVGQTTYLKGRVFQHMQETKFYKLNDIYYFYCNSKEQMNINENYYIKKCQPILNKTLYTTKTEIINEDLIIKEPQWIKYEQKEWNWPQPLIDF